MRCSICPRKVPEPYREKHHLIPKSKKGKDTIMVCCDCGNQLHELFTIKELATQYNTVEKIVGNSKIQKWIRWIQKRNFGICMKKKKRR